MLLIIQGFRRSIFHRNRHGRADASYQDG
jgi:hypothetical protein